MFHPGDILSNRFEVIKMINEGLFSTIFSARDRKSNLEVAIKQPKYDDLGFKNEYKMLKRLRPYNFSPTTLHFGGRSPKTYFYAMSLEGKNLNELAGTDGFKDRTVPLILYHGLMAIKFLHGIELSHGDVSLTNICCPRSPSKARLILVDPSEAKVLDKKSSRRDLNCLLTSVELVGRGHDIFIRLHRLLETSTKPEDFIQVINSLPDFNAQEHFQWEEENA